MDSENAAMPGLKHELRNFSFHFTFDDSSGMVLAEARGRGVGEGADSVKSDEEVVEKRLNSGILTSVRGSTGLGCGL